MIITPNINSQVVGGAVLSFVLPKCLELLNTSDVLRCKLVVMVTLPASLSSSQTQATGDGCFAYHYQPVSVYSVISLDSSMSRTVNPQESLKTGC